MGIMSVADVRTQKQLHSLTARHDLVELIDLLDRQVFKLEVFSCKVDVSAAPLKMSRIEVLPARARATLITLAMLSST